VDHEGQQCGLRLSAVDEGEAFLRGEPIGIELGRGECPRRGDGGAITGEGLPLTHERQPDMAEGRQVSTGPDAPLLRHERYDTAVEQGNQCVHQLRTDAAGRTEKHVRPEQHDGADGRRREWGPHARSVTANQIGLELVQLVGRDAHIGELAETGVDPIDRVTRSDGPVYQCPALEERTPCLGLNPNTDGWITRHPNHISDCERLSVENARWLGHRPKLVQYRRRFNPCQRFCTSSSGFPRSVWKAQSRIRKLCPTWVTRTAPYRMKPSPPSVSNT
jgi:hypothetical protein